MTSVTAVAADRAISGRSAGANGKFARGDDAIVTARRRIDEERPAATDASVERRQPPDVERPALLTRLARRCPSHRLEIAERVASGRPLASSRRRTRSRCARRRSPPPRPPRRTSRRHGDVSRIASMLEPHRELDVVRLVGGQPGEVGHVELGIQIARDDLFAPSRQRLVEARARRVVVAGRAGASVSCFDGNR